MDSTAHIVRLPLTALVVACGGLITLWWGCILVLRSARSRRDPEAGEAEKDWSIPAVDAHAAGDSLFHRWDPRIKLVTLLLYMLCLASLSQLRWAGLGFLSALLAVRLAGIPFRYPLRRLAAMGMFLAMFLVVMPLTAPVRSGDTVLIFEGVELIALNLRGLLLALLICVKACAIAMWMEPLLSTAPFAVTIQALATLKVSAPVCQMLLLAHRYVFVFQDETRRMMRGMEARGFEKRANVETLRTLGNFLGMLMVRSFERTQRIYDAMLSRGYDGSFAVVSDFRPQGRDWVKAGFWLAIGIGLVAADRLFR